MPKIITRLMVFKMYFFLDMEIFPLLGLGILNGWILLAIFWATEVIFVLMFPKGTRGRLFKYDHSRWSKKNRILFVIGRIIALICLILVFFTPLKIGSINFLLGIIIYAIGLTGFATALTNFKNTPKDQPVISGIYRISRNPQVLSIFIISLGMCLAIGSWIAILFLLVGGVFSRVRLLEEERDCLEQYGEAYRTYMTSVPRYLLIKTRIKDEEASS
ncbi:MAG: methyltransferase family protein [Promethearchaeota archaeon]